MWIIPDSLWKSLVVGRVVASAQSTDAGRRSPSPTRRHPTEAGRRAIPAWPRAPKPSRWGDQRPRSWSLRLGASPSPRLARPRSAAEPAAERLDHCGHPPPTAAPAQPHAPNPSQPKDQRPRGRPPRPGAASSPRRARPQGAPCQAAPMLAFRLLVECMDPDGNRMGADSCAPVGPAAASGPGFHIRWPPSGPRVSARAIPVSVDWRGPPADARVPRFTMNFPHSCEAFPPPVCVECLIGKQKKPILFEVTEPSSIP